MIYGTDRGTAVSRLDEKMQDVKVTATKRMLLIVLQRMMVYGR